MPPWALAGLAFLSFTTNAGSSPNAAAPPGWRSPLAPRDIAAFDSRARVASLTLDWGLPTHMSSVDRLARSARLLDELAPSLEMKNDARDFPTVDRKLKGDPAVALRPSVSNLAPQSGMPGSKPGLFGG